MSVVDGVPEPYRTVLVEVLGTANPALLAELRSKAEPTSEEWDAVTETLNDAASAHWIPGSDYEMDERGLAIDLAMGAFINAFVHVNDRGPDGSDGPDGTGGSDGRPG